jgi:hypothetical protein
MAKAVTALGLLLTFVGALVLSWRDLGGKTGIPRPSYQDVLDGMPRREAKLGFPLIALGTLLQGVGLFL